MTNLESKENKELRKIVEEMFSTDQSITKYWAFWQAVYSK